jgi:hypothetical protein
VDQRQPLRPWSCRCQMFPQIGYSVP